MKIMLLTGAISKLENKIKEKMDLDIKVNKSVLAKKLILRVDSKGRKIILSMPRFCASKKAFDFVLENQEWIEEKLDNLPVMEKFVNGLVLSIFGKKIKIVHSPEVKAGAFLEKEVLYVSGGEEFLHRRTRDFIKKEARRKFSKLSMSKAQDIGKKINNIYIKDTKTRWGSCSSLKNINYNWRIAFAPHHVFEYLVCHEVSHLKYQNHSDKFWACVESLCPDYEKGRDWLQKNGKELYLYE